MRVRALLDRRFEYCFIACGAGVDEIVLDQSLVALPEGRERVAVRMQIEQGAGKANAAAITAYSAADELRTSNIRRLHTIR